MQLHVPVAVQQGQQYSFHLSSPASQNTHTRLGLMVADSYLAGTNNFEVWTEEPHTDMQRRLL